jgi:Protein of unknown function (DUF2795)
MAERGSDKHGPRLDEDLHQDAGADLAGFLTPGVLPADREALLADAAGNHAPTAVPERLKTLPADRTYGNVPDVWGALGGTVEHRV